MWKRDKIQLKQNPCMHGIKSKWKCTSVCAMHDKLNAKNIQGTLF